MRSNKFITPEVIEIPLTASFGTILVGRYAYWNPRKQHSFKLGGVQATRLIGEEVEKVASLYPGFDREDRFVWLSNRPAKTGTAYKIDLSRLNILELRSPKWTPDVLYRGNIPASAIVGTIRPAPITESKANDHIKEVVGMIQRDCSDFLGEWDHQTPLFMGLRGVKPNQRLFPDTSRFIYSSVEPRERGDDITGKHFTAIIDDAMKKTGFTATRLNSVRVTGNLDLAHIEGGVYAIFPLNGYNFSWSTIVGDYVRHFADSPIYHATSYPRTKFGLQLRIMDYWKSIEGSYATTDINAAIASGHEILLAGSGFYGIQAHTFAEIAKKGLL
jgi:hypothetical protein